MNRQYGDWQQAKNVLENLSEPNKVLDKNEDGISLNMPDILGYPVIYTKRNTHKGIKSFITVMNPNTNSCYVKNYSQIEDNSDIFK